METINQDDPELWVRDYAKLAEDMSRRAEEAQEKFADIRGEGANRYAKVAVNSGGIIEAVQFSSHVRQLTPESLAEEFMSAYSVAVTAVNGQTAEFVQGITGGDDAMSEYVRGVVPTSVRERAEQAENSEEPR